MTKARKAKTAMVFNPSRGLSLRGRSSVRRSSKARTTNPTRKIAAKANPRRKTVRRRRNPASTTGLVTAAVMTGVFITFYDVVTNKVMPATSPLIRVATKFGLAAVLQSSWGNKLPVFAKYKNELALVFAVSGVIDGFKLWVLPVIAPYSGGLLPAASTTQLIDAPQADGLANIYSYNNSSAIY